MKSFNLLLAVCMLLVTISACKQDIMAPIPNDGTTPKPITNPTVQNLLGSALITYTLPDDPSLLYVKAEYDFQGAKVNVISSYYKKTILIEGFADTLTHDITLYAVSRGEKASTPVTVQIKPLIAPIQNVFASLNVTASFGGFSVKLANPTKGNVVIGVLRFDTIQKAWVQIDTYYSNLVSAEFSTRGLDSIKQQFGFYAKDRWNNKTDTLKLMLKPIYEIQLDRTKFVDMRNRLPIPQMDPLPQSGLGLKELHDYSSAYRWANMFDGKTVAPMFHSQYYMDQPSWLPVDLGIKYKISRYKLWQRTDLLFQQGNPHEWEIWGTNNPADVNSWVKLTHEIMIKPSGLPLGMNNNDDITVGTQGQEYMIPVDAPAVRYIAWKNIDSWASIEGATGIFSLYELSFWGQVVK